MTEQHDTREAVEAMKAALVSIHDRGWIAEEDCDRAADMLRRLLARAEAAEAMCAGYRANESDLLAERDALAFERNNLLAALATARADALRDVVRLMGRCIRSRRRHPLPYPRAGGAA